MQRENEELNTKCIALVEKYEAREKKLRIIADLLDETGAFL